MVRRMPRKVILALITFFVFLFVLNWSFPSERRCNDGWKSPSIGRQGACSSHGGVAADFGFLYFLISAGFGVWAYHLLEKRELRRSQSDLNIDVQGGDAAAEPPTRVSEARLPAPVEVWQFDDPVQTAVLRTSRRARLRKTARGKVCPTCGGAMYQRKAMRGRYRGKLFYGCVRYPDCGGIIST